MKAYFKTRRFAPCVVSGKEYATFFYLACRKMGMPLVMWEHTNFTVGVPLKSEWTGMHIALRNFAAVVCLTKKDEKAYLAHKKSAAVRQIYNITTYQESPAPYRIQSKKIISVGYLNPIKGFDMALEAARTVFRRHPDWSWDIYGERDERAALETAIAEYGLRNHVRLMGCCSDVTERYSEYAMFVMTSRKEGQGMVLLEAQKNHLPVVSFDILCGPSDVITDGGNGYLVPPFDTAVMAERICSLIEEPKKREAFSRHACDCHTGFDPAYILSQWEKLILDCAKEN